MKKLYKENKYREYNKKRSKRAIQILQQSKKKESVGTFGNIIAPNIQVAEQHMIAAPSVFSVIENYEETVSFFYKIYNCIDRGWYMFINLEDIKRLTPDALLYLLALLDRSKRNAKPVQFRGNSPRDEAIHELFECSGFYKYVLSDQQNRNNKDILSVESGQMPNPKCIGTLISFIRDKFGIIEPKETIALYSVIMDAMINVYEHAYTGKNTKNRCWWLMAKYESNNSIVFALVDNGRGIPATIRKKYLGLGDILSNDAELIASTVKGENRSETGELYRGKGLPKIREYALSGRIEDLYIVSKKGYYIVNDDSCIEQKLSFLGTLLTWRFIRN